MRTTAIGIAATALLTFASAVTQAQSWMPPAENQRCPSKWGAGDERGLHEFAFVMQPLKLQGATGSTVAPVAIR